MNTLLARLVSWPIAVMLAINLSRLVVNDRWAKWGRLGALLLLLGTVWRMQT